MVLKPLPLSWAGPTVSGNGSIWNSVLHLPLSPCSMSLIYHLERLYFLIALIYGESVFVVPPDL